VHNSLLHLLIENCTFLSIDISQSSVTTRLGVATLQQRKAVAAKQQNAVHDQQSVSH